MAWAIAVAFGLTPTFWRFSVVAEVYSLNLLFVALVSDSLVKWRQTLRDRDLLLACAWYVASFGNHLTMITLLPAFVFFVVATRWRVLVEWKLVCAVGGLILLGLVPYAYPVVRSLDPDTPYLAHVRDEPRGALGLRDGLGLPRRDVRVHDLAAALRAGADVRALLLARVRAAHPAGRGGSRGPRRPRHGRLPGPRLPRPPRLRARLRHRRRRQLLHPDLLRDRGARRRGTRADPLVESGPARARRALPRCSRSGSAPTIGRRSSA